MKTTDFQPDSIAALRGIEQQVATAWATFIDQLPPDRLEQLQAALADGQRPGLLVIPAAHPEPLTVRFVTAGAQGQVRAFATVQAQPVAPSGNALN